MTTFGPPLPGRRIDLYLVSQLLRPLALCLLFVMVALLIERILRLVSLIAEYGGSFGVVATMAANLLPHYLGLALPAAFFISILLLIARLAEDSEIDAILSSGISLRRIVVPFVALGCFLALISLFLAGYVQPHSRYGYRAALNTLVESEWGGVIPSGVFLDLGQGITLYADEVNTGGNLLSDVFINEQKPNGGMITTTAAFGSVMRDPNHGNRLVLKLRNGSQLRVFPGGAATQLSFEALMLERKLPFHGAEFRQRGRDERELTLLELVRASQADDGPIPRRVIRGELHGRLAQAATVLVIPLLALPMGMAAKRRRRGAGVVLAAAILMLYFHTLQLGQGMVEAGGAHPALTIWLPFGVLAGFSAWVLFFLSRRPGEPWNEVLDAIADAMEAVGHYGRRLVGRRR